MLLLKFNIQLVDRQAELKEKCWYVNYHLFNRVELAYCFHFRWFIKQKGLYMC